MKNNMAQSPTSLAAWATSRMRIVWTTLLTSWAFRIRRQSERSAPRGTYAEPNGTMGKAVVAWYEWQLQGKKDEKKMFVGAACECGKNTIESATERPEVESGRRA